MGVNGSIAGRSSEVLALTVGDVFAVALDVAFGESEVEDEDAVGRLVQSDAEVVGLDVAVDEVPVVDVLDAGDHLVHQHQHRLQRQLAQGLLEQVLQRRAHQVHHQHVVVA
jgi:hypothetical protein